MTNEESPKRAQRMRPTDPTGLALVDALPQIAEPTIADYIRAASEYVRLSRPLSDGQRKAAQIRLSACLARTLTVALRNAEPAMAGVLAGERDVSGALRTVKADVSETHPLDGLRLAVELKPVNLAVGRAIWNRFGDIRTFAVNLHLKFPFAVVGGVLAIPTYEEAVRDTVVRRDTRHLISRAVERLARAGGRQTEGDAPHLLEGVGVIVYDPDTGLLDDDLPTPGRGLRWDEFVTSLVTAYRSRFVE